MPLPMTRRAFVAGITGLLLAVPQGRAEAGPGLARRLAELEQASDGRLGVSIIDMDAGTRVAHRGDERFALCSTYKLLAAAHLLHRADSGLERLDRKIRYGVEDLVGTSKFTGRYAGGSGVTLGDLARAAIVYSDSTAGNLMVRAAGGPEALTAFLRSAGDAVTRVDRYEPDLAEAAPGDVRDTTTPDAMAANLQRLIAGDLLSAPSRALLLEWLLASETGADRLRAGVPAGWRVGDKTGSSRNGVSNDVGFLQRPDGAPIIVAVYLEAPNTASRDRNAIIADVARAVVEFG